MDPQRILVVDDNADAADTLAELLRVLDYDACCAGDAPSALRVLDEWQADVALLDIGLPGTDGYGLCALIRGRPGGDRIKLVALTGYGSDEDRDRSSAAGFDGHLVKPVNPAELMETLKRLLA